MNKIHHVLFIGRAQYFFLKNLIKYSEEGRAPFRCFGAVSDGSMCNTTVFTSPLSFSLRGAQRRGRRGGAGAGAGAGAQLNLPQF